MLSCRYSSVIHCRVFLSNNLCVARKDLLHAENKQKEISQTD